MNTHDGTSALKMFFSPIRVVCNNTLNASLRTVQDSVSIRHHGNISLKISEARDALKIANNYYTDFQKVAENLRLKVLDKRTVENLLEELFVPKKKEIDSTESLKDISQRTQNKIDRVRDLYLNDPKNNLPGMSQTAWGFYNAVSQYYDHEATEIGTDKRMNSILMGSGVALKQKAFQLVSA